MKKNVYFRIDEMQYKYVIQICLKKERILSVSVQYRLGIEKIPEL